MRVIMNKMSLFVAMMIMVLNGSTFGSAEWEKRSARQKIVALKQQIKQEEDIYTSAMQMALNPKEKHELTKKHYQEKIQLLEHIAEQRTIINARSFEQRLWDAAKVIGPLAMMAFGAYQWFKLPTEPLVQKLPQPLTTEKYVEQPKIIEQPEESKLIPIQTSVKKDVITPVSSVQMPSQPLTKEEYEKYKKKANAFGIMTAYWVFAHSLLGGQLFYPYIAMYSMAGVYNAAKALQIKLKK